MCWWTGVGMWNALFYFSEQCWFGLYPCCLGRPAQAASFRFCLRESSHFSERTKKHSTVLPCIVPWGTQNTPVGPGSPVASSLIGQIRRVNRHSHYRLRNNQSPVFQFIKLSAQEPIGGSPFCFSHRVPFTLSRAFHGLSANNNPSKGGTMLPV